MAWVDWYARYVMRILLVGNYPLDDQPSMSRYAEMLRREMMHRGHAAELVLPGAFFGLLHREGPMGKWLGYIDKYLLFPWVLRRLAKGFDLVHICDHSNSMYLPHTAGSAKYTKALLVTTETNVRKVNIAVPKPSRKVTDSPLRTRRPNAR